MVTTRKHEPTADHRGETTRSVRGMRRTFDRRDMPARNAWWMLHRPTLDALWIAQTPAARLSRESQAKT